MKLDHSLTSFIHKDKLKMDERSKCETRIHQNPRGNTLFELGHSNFLQDTSMKAKETKAKRTIGTSST